MKSLHIFLLVLFVKGLVALGAAVPSPGDSITNDLPFVNVAASNSLARLRRHITTSNYQLMGFETASEILSATNGSPLLSFTIPFNKLTNYQAGNDLNTLLVPPLKTRVFVPIMVGTNVRSSLV